MMWKRPDPELNVHAESDSPEVFSVRVLQWLKKALKHEKLNQQRKHLETRSSAARTSGRSLWAGWYQNKAHATSKQKISSTKMHLQRTLLSPDRDLAKKIEVYS